MARRDKVPFLLRLNKDVKEQLIGMARSEHRSLNQQIEVIIENFLARAVEQRTHGGQPPDIQDEHQISSRTK
jgi:hypothetical protein